MYSVYYIGILLQVLIQECLDEEPVLVLVVCTYVYPCVIHNPSTSHMYTHTHTHTYTHTHTHAHAHVRAHMHARTHTHTHARTHAHTRTHTHTQVVWFVVHESLHRMLLPMLKWDQEGISVSCSVQFPPHNYTSRQCTALENVLESVKVGVWSVGGCVECRWVCGV